MDTLCLLRRIDAAVAARHSRARRRARHATGRRCSRRGRVDRRRGLSRGRVHADALDARVVARRHSVRPARNRGAGAARCCGSRLHRVAAAWRHRDRQRYAWRVARIDRAAARHARDSHRVAAPARVDRDSLRAAGARSHLAAALSVGRVDPVGDEGARLVRAGSHRAVRAERGMVRRGRLRLVRRVAGISADGAAAAGLDVHRARPLGRHADERAVVAILAGADHRGLRRAALTGHRRASGAGRRVSRRLAAARERPRRARRLRRSADGRLLHGARRLRSCAGPNRARCTMRDSRSSWPSPARRSRFRASSGR